MSNTPPFPDQEIINVSLADEMKQSYLDYAMSVIVSRAIPNVCDGLKPVHRRILYAMNESGYTHGRPYRKSARIVGDVMGKYHPHGNVPIYDAMVRMAQDFSMRLPLIDGQGNFGSMDGDSAAAERYTEARLESVAQTLLEDIDKDTVPFQPNYDNSTEEPIVLPARFPNLLINGAGGIAVGMATNIPPHNLGEVIDACLAYVDNNDITIEELMEYIPGPDFPTGAQIIGRRGIYEAYHTGRGSVMMRGKTHVEEKNNKESIIITEVPYQVNKARMLERMAELVNAKTIEGISDLRDESDRDGVRVVIEIKRDADANVILNQLHKHTPLQTSFGCNILALHKGRPSTLNLKDIISAFIAFREEVIIKRTKYELQKAREKAHLFLGLAIAVVNIDEVIALIRSAKNPAEAREALIARAWPCESILPLIRMVDEIENPEATYTLSEAQARAILELRLHRLTGLEREKIREDLEALTGEIQECLGILSHRHILLGVLKTELFEIKEKFATPRRTEIIEGDIHADIESLIQQEDMVVTVTHNGYIKRVPLSTYRAQKRGGKGRTGMSTRDEDFVDNLFVANTHTPILFFTSAGKVYNLKVYKLPMASAQSRGKALINILPLDKGEKLSAIMPMPENEETWDNLQIMFATDKGNVRRNLLSDFTNIRANGKIAMKLDEEESLIGVATCSEQCDILLTANNGRSVRFHSTDVRVFAGRNSTGVRGIKLGHKDRVISMAVLHNSPYTPEQREAYLKLSRHARTGESITHEFADNIISQDLYEEMANKEQFILTITENGYGKRSSAYEFRCTNRGTQGIANMEITPKTGDIVASFPVADTDQLMLVTNSGQLIRSAVKEIRIAGRRTQGVRLFRIEEDMRVVSADRLEESSEEEEEEATQTDEMDLSSENDTQDQ